MTTFKSLPLTQSNKACSLIRITTRDEPLMDLTTSATKLMTDFCRNPAISTPASTQIDTALDQMIFSGVRLLFVVDADFTLLGLVTSFDIQSEKPMLYLQSKDCRIGTCSRDDVTVQDIMTPLNQCEMLDFDEMETATLGDIVETFKSVRRRHLLVSESSDGNSNTIRGLFSITDIERALGISIEITGE